MGANTTGALATVTAMRAFERSLPMALLRARESVMTRFRPILLDHNITEQQFRVIRAVNAAGSIEVGQLAHACSILPPSMAGILKRLEARGLIERRSDVADRRRSHVSLTDEARQLLEAIAPLSERQYQHIEERFGRDRLDELHELLAELVEALDEGE